MDEMNDFENTSSSDELDDAILSSIDEINESVLAPSKDEETAIPETDYAFAWSENQGNYSQNIAKKTMNFIRNQGLVVNDVLDICCGSANFLDEMQRFGKKCTGTEILDSYIEYDRKAYPNIEFYKSKDLLDFDELGTFDLVSCNHDVVNFLPTLDDWSTLFRRVYSHLNDGGIFIFDFYTKRKLHNWNEVTYDESDKLDYVRNVVSDGVSKTTISNIYYTNINPKERTISAIDSEYSLNDYDKRFKRTENSDTEYYFDNEEIIEVIKHSGYRYLITTDANFAPVSSIADMNRVHVIAIKREN